MASSVPKLVKPRMTRKVERQYRKIINKDISVSRTIEYELPWGYLSRRVYKWSLLNRVAYAALLFCKQYHGYEGVDFSRIQNLVLLHGNFETLYRWAREIPLADIKKSQRAAAKCGTSSEIRKFAMNVPGCNREFLLSVALVKEVMAL